MCRKTGTAGSKRKVTPGPKKKSKRCETKDYIILMKDNDLFDVWDVNDMDYTMEEFEWFCQKFHLTYKFTTHEDADRIETKHQSAMLSGTKHDQTDYRDNRQSIDPRMALPYRSCI